MELKVKFDPLFGGKVPVASVTNNGKQVVSVDSSATTTLVALSTPALAKSILTLEARVNLPLASTVNVPTCVEEP